MSVIVIIYSKLSPLTPTLYGPLTNLAQMNTSLLHLISLLPTFPSIPYLLGQCVPCSPLRRWLEFIVHNVTHIRLSKVTQTLQILALLAIGDGDLYPSQVPYHHHLNYP